MIFGVWPQSCCLLAQTLCTKPANAGTVGHSTDRAARNRRQKHRLQCKAPDFRRCGAATGGARGFSRA